MSRKYKVQWFWGNRCNYDCFYCPPGLHNNKLELPSEEEFLEAVQYLAGLIRLEDRDPVFEFTGGEPSVLPYFGRALQAVQGNSEPNAVLVTNGSGSLEWWKDVAPYFKYVEISYHPQYANRNHIIDVYKFLKQQENYIDVKVRVHVSNDDEHWLRGISAYEYFKMMFIKSDLKLLYSNFMKGNQFYPYKTYQLEYYYHTIGKKFETEKTVYKDTAIVPRRQRHDINQKTLTGEEFNFEGKLCHAGLDQLIVTSDGDVYKGWCKSGGKLGNVKERNIVIPTEPTLCSINYCRNGFDRQAKKII